MKKYLIIPGYIESKIDGQIHYIDSKTLIKLYKVSRDECAIDYNLNAKNREGITELRPKYDGDYSLPKNDKEKDGENLIEGV